MKLLVVQPVLTSYRVPFFEDINSYDDVTVCVYSNKSSPEFGSVTLPSCDFVDACWMKFIGLYFTSFSKYLKSFFCSDNVLHVADFKYVSLWVSLILGRFSRTNVWIHGQGGYKRKGNFHKIIYLFSVFMSNGYICYTNFSAERLKSILPVFLHSKIHVVDNTLYLEAVEVFLSRTSTDLFYIGRVRYGCGLDFLLEAALRAGVNVRIIGGGEELYIQKLRVTYPNASFFGSIFDRDEQLEIAKGCMAGAYGGDAGLSVVHYMAFSLPVIVHSDITNHMGPEPSYVEHEKNGLLFERGNLESLVEAIVRIKEDKLGANLSQGALKTFNKLSMPTMAEKFLKIIGVC